MGGKSMKAMNDTAVDNENHNAAEVSPAVSILSGQSASPRENQDGGSGVTDPAPGDLQEQNTCSETLESNSNNKQGLFLNTIRNKLISDLSSGIFHSNLETEIDKKDVTQINSERLSIIEQILVQIYLLSDPEKLLLYLKLTNSQNNPADPLNWPLHLLGNQQEIQQAIVWIRAKLGEIEEKSVLKRDVYDQYMRKRNCRNGSMKTLSSSDLGKTMNEAYPEGRLQRLGTRDCATVSTGNTEERTDNYKKELKTRSKSPKIPSATVVRDSAPEDSKLSDIENLTIQNKVSVNLATELNFTNDLNTNSENKHNLSQPLVRLPTTNIGDVNCALGKNIDSLSDNVTEVTKDDYINNKIILNFLDKVQLNNEDLNVTGVDESDKSNEVTSTQNVNSAESQPNTLLPAGIPLNVFKRIIQVSSLKSLNTQRSLRFQGRKSLQRSQRFRARRPPPQSQRCRRRRSVSVRSEPVNLGTYWLNFQSRLRNTISEVSDSPRVMEKIVKYFGHLEDTELLGVVGETMVNELLKLKLEEIARNIFSGLGNIRESRNQISLENTSGAHTPAEVDVQGELPQRIQSSDEYSAEETVTFQKQGNIEYVSNHQLLISNSENMPNVNPVELNTQNNTFIDTRQENSSVSSSANYFHFVHIFPGSKPNVLPSETSPFFSHQTAHTMLNNNFLPPNHCTRPHSYFLPLNHDFLLPNNVLPPNNNLIYSDNTFLPENNTDVNYFDNVNTGILNGAFNEQSNIILQGTFPEPMPYAGPENYSANFYCLNTPGNSHENSSAHGFLPNEANFNQVSMETNFAFQNFPDEIDQLLINHPHFEDPRASVARSQLGLVNSMTDGEFCFPNSSICNDTNNTVVEYSKEQTDLFDSNEHCFEPISHCQAEGPVIDSEPFPMLSLDDLAMDSDDISDQIFSHNVISDPNNFNFDNNSLDTLPGNIDENNVIESSFSTENINSYLQPFQEQLNQTDSLLALGAGDIDFFDNFFDDSAENSRDPGGGTLTLAMDECTSYHESSPFDIFSHETGINNQLNECTSYELSPLDNFFNEDSLNNQLNEYLGLN